MKYIPLIVIAVFSPLLYATTGEPSYIKSIYYDKSQNKIYYEFDWGYGEVLYSLTLDTGKQVQLAGDDSDNKEELETFEKTKQTITQFYSPLKEVNLNKIGISAFVKPNSIIRQTRDKYYEGDALNNFLFGEVISWDINAVRKNKIIGSGTFFACSGTDDLKIRGYSDIGLNFVAIVTSTHSSCYEGGYTGETIFIGKNVKISADVIKREQKDSYTLDDGRHGFGSLSIPLSEHTLSSFINDYGMKAYHERKYNTAVAYFDFAHFTQQGTNKYHLPLFNAACTYSLLGETDKAFKALTELLSFKETREKYLRKIKRDKDFDKLRSDIRYQQLFNANSTQTNP